jgi:uncharacterized protein YajQ (UPF0234 family)
MEIPERPYDDRFQVKLQELEITDPDVEDFFLNLARFDDKRKDAAIALKSYEILGSINSYTEEQILQYASLFLQYSPKRNLEAGTIMKRWKEHHNGKQNVANITNDVADNVKNVQ